VGEISHLLILYVMHDRYFDEETYINYEKRKNKKNED